MSLSCGRTFTQHDSQQTFPKQLLLFSSFVTVRSLVLGAMRAERMRDRTDPRLHFRLFISQRLIEARGNAFEVYRLGAD